MFEARRSEWPAPRGRATVTIARRRGNTWFLGSMTNWSPRQFEIPLSFLASGRYTAEIYADSPDADQYPKNGRRPRHPLRAGAVIRVGQAGYPLGPPRQPRFQSKGSLRSKIVQKGLVSFFS